MDFGWLALIAVVSFLLGSIPWGVVISKGFYHKDIRNEGSGNIGTTNAVRALGKKGGIIVFFLDFGKGIVSGVIGVLVSLYMGTDYSLCTAVAFAGCVWGHLYSPWLHFKGGKGIATAIGALLFVFGWLGFLLEWAVFIILVPTTRYVSVGSIGSVVACPFIALWLLWGHWPSIIICTLVSITMLWAHRGNIDRLIHGTENRIGSKKKQAD